MQRHILQLPLAFVAILVMAGIVLGKPMSNSAVAVNMSLASIDPWHLSNRTLVRREGDVPAVETAAEDDAKIGEDDSDDEPYMDAINAPKYWPCDDNTTCGFGYTCQSGLCKLGCSTNDDCAPKQKCDSGHCVRSNGRVCRQLRRVCWSDEACCSGKCEGWFYPFLRTCVSSAKHG